MIIPKHPSKRPSDPLLASCNDDYGSMPHSSNEYASPMVLDPISVRPLCSSQEYSSHLDLSFEKPKPSPRNRPSLRRFMASCRKLVRNCSSSNLRPLIGWPSPPAGNVDWISLIVVYWITLVSEASRGLMLPSTWPYFESFGGSKQMLGVFVASFSIGRMATTIPLGYLSDSYPTSVVLVVASLVQVLGQFLYAVAPSLPMLFVGRIIVGFGSATMSVCRAHITRAIPSNIRTHHFAYLSATQFIGFAVLPGAGGLLAMLPEYQPLPFMALNGFTYPAYCLVFSNLVSVILIYCLYVNPPSSQQAQATTDASPSEEDEEGASSPSSSSSVLMNSSLRSNVVAIITSLLVNVSFRGVVAELETITTPFLMEQYNVSYSGASAYISMIGIVGLIVFVFFKPISIRFSDRSLVMFGLVVVLIGCAPLSVSLITSNMSVWVYLVLLSLTWSVAYPIGQTAAVSIFSKALGNLPAGSFLGLFSASGSIARVIFATVGSLMWGSVGRESVFGGIVMYISLATLLVGCTMSELGEYREKEGDEA